MSMIFLNFLPGGFLYSMFLISSGSSIILEIELVSLNSSSVVMSLLLDWMYLMFAVFVLFISSMVIYYSGSFIY